MYALKHTFALLSLSNYLYFWSNFLFEGTKMRTTNNSFQNWRQKIKRNKLRIRLLCGNVKNAEIIWIPKHTYKIIAGSEPTRSWNYLNKLKNLCNRNIHKRKHKLHSQASMKVRVMDFPPLSNTPYNHA